MCLRFLRNLFKGFDFVAKTVRYGAFFFSVLQEEEVLFFNNGSAPYLTVTYRKDEMVIETKHSIDKTNYYLTLSVVNVSVLKFTYKNFFNLDWSRKASRFYANRELFKSKVI
jgi:hypothetical protein